MLDARGLALTRSGRQVLRDLSLSARPGELLALCGPNGAGKSTLLGMLAGDIRPDVGSIHLDGIPLASLSPRALARRRAALEQAPELAAPFQVRELVMLGLSSMPEIAPRDAALIVARAMQDTGVENMAGRPADRLSGGERARAHLARALAQLAGGRALGHGAGWLLLDEPTASLDLGRQAEAMRAARAAADRGAGVIAALHDLNLAAAFADRVALIAGGALVAFAPPAEALDQELLSSVYAAPVEVRRAASGALRIVPVYETPHASRVCDRRTACSSP